MGKVANSGPPGGGSRPRGSGFSFPIGPPGGGGPSGRGGNPAQGGGGGKLGGNCHGRSVSCLLFLKSLSLDMIRWHVIVR